MTEIARARLDVDQRRLSGLADAIGTSSAAETAALVPFFGPTITGHAPFLAAMPFDPGRTTLGRQRYRWTRPFRLGDTVDAVVTLDSVVERSSARLYVVRSTFADGDGDVVQTQETTFVERRPS